MLSNQMLHYICKVLHSFSHGGMPLFSSGSTAVVSVNDVTEEEDNDSSAIFEDAEDGTSGPSKTPIQNGLPKSPDSGIQGDKSATELTV